MRCIGMCFSQAKCFILKTPVYEIRAVTIQRCVTAPLGHEFPIHLTRLLLHNNILSGSMILLVSMYQLRIGPDKILQAKKLKVG